MITVERPQQEKYNSDVEFKNNTETWVAETLHGSLRSTFNFNYYNGDLMSQGGESLTEVFDNSISAAEVIVQEKPNLLFELRRRLIERQELNHMILMAEGDLPNTMIVVSDFPNELMDTAQDVGGYNVNRQQTFLRVIKRQTNGQISVTSQTLDGSNRQALEAIYHHLGALPKPGEMLGQRIYLDIDCSSQDMLVDDLINVYDQSLNEQYGGQWYAGIKQDQTQNMINTYDFVCKQQDLIKWFIKQENNNLLDNSKNAYSLAATMKERYQKQLLKVNQQSKLVFESTPPEILNQNILNEIQHATTIALQNQDVFSGCGSSLGGGSESSLLGYGNQTSQEQTYSFDKEMFCVGCQKPSREGDKKKMCGPCGLCRTCDRFYGGKG